MSLSLLERLSLSRIRCCRALPMWSHRSLKPILPVIGYWLACTYSNSRRQRNRFYLNFKQFMQFLSRLTANFMQILRRLDSSIPHYHRVGVAGQAIRLLLAESRDTDDCSIADSNFDSKWQPWPPPAEPTKQPSMVVGGRALGARGAIQHSHTRTPPLPPQPYSLHWHHVTGPASPW
jgi:hypothetical protein